MAANLKAPSNGEGSEHSLSPRMTPNQSEMPVDVDSNEELVKEPVPRPNVLPHGDDLLDAKYIGGIYDEKIHRSNWKIDSKKL